MDIFGIRRRREAREKAEREALLARRGRQEAYIFSSGSNKAAQYAGGLTRRTDDYQTSYSPMTDILSPLNPASPLSIYGGSSSYDSSPSCSSSDGGSSSSDSGSCGGGSD